MNNLKISKTRTVAKGEILLSKGDICKQGFMVKEGCLKSYVIDNAGKEHILQFAPEGWLISDLGSFTNEEPTMIFIDAIENSVVDVISKFDFDDLNNLDKETLISMNIKYRNNLIASNKRIINLLSSTAEHRYNEFTQLYPTLVQRLSLKQIASFIGITPEYLSDIRRKLSGKK